ncbi:GGDEF domain-containing protein [Hydrogenimonas sp.]|uniref:GGDEF domain-containing protein n=1 Tax=Hydrogenimonas sp. TaxID=2231112 RepID=UPI00262604EA|nr:GGDEF domain-containing protein [Hydrogenimonas sp.]
MKEKIIEKLLSIRESLKFEWIQEDETLLQKKLDDHRSFSGKLFLLGTLIGSGLWIWDYVTDPVGAKDTIWLRMFFFIFLPAPYLFRKITNRLLLTLLFVGAVLLTEAVYLKILTRLDMGMIYGIAGFMYYMLLPPLAFQAFSLRANIVYVVMATFLPHLLAWSGFAPGFQHDHYAVLIWPAAALAILIQYFYARDYKKRYELEKELERMSYTDMLSGLNNRRHFMAFLKKEFERYRRTGKSFSLLMIDIDRFKRINDTYGHPVGDSVIRTLADIVRDEIREMDFPARIGGEEFAVILPEIDAKNALKVAERIREKAQNHPVDIPGGEPARFTVSIGVAAAGADSDETSLIKEADEALYRAKREGRNRVVLYDSSSS